MELKLEIKNKKAYHDYFINDTIECGISLSGNEVKSIKKGNVNIKDAWCDIEHGQLIVTNMHISRWNTTNIFDAPDEKRKRTLLAHKKEILSLSQKKQQDGITLIPLKIYLHNNKVKVLVGLCKGKKQYDKRDALKAAQSIRDINRELKNR